MKKNLKGFTLIELMIVVAIIGILAAVAIPKFADLVTKSKEAGVKGTIGSLRSALSIYYGDTEGGYPGNLFDGITTGDRYMPRQSGVESLGRYSIPSHSRNTGHTGPVYQNASDVTAVVNGDLTAADDTSPLLYQADNTSASWGEVLINCTHMDTKGVVWTTY